MTDKELRLVKNLDSRLLRRYQTEAKFKYLCDTIANGLRKKEFTTADLSQATEVAIELQ